MEGLLFKDTLVVTQAHRTSSTTLLTLLKDQELTFTLTLPTVLRQLVTKEVTSALTITPSKVWLHSTTPKKSEQAK